MMQSTDHLVWEADRVAFNLGTITLPFPIALWGLVAALAAIIWAWPKIKPESREGEKAEPPAWKAIGLVLGALVGGQLLFLVLPSPTISRIGPLQPHWYGFLFAGAFVAGYLVEARFYRDGGRSMEELERLLTYMIVATVIGARLGHVLFYDPLFYLTHPAEILAVWEGGLASHGAAIGILLAMYLYVKRTAGMSFLWLADRVVVAVALGGAFIRTGNFVNSEIIGKPTDLPWGVIFKSRVDLEMVPRHPTMLYEALLCLAVFGVLLLLYRRYRSRPPEGSLFSVFLVLLFGGRFFLEYTKLHQAAFATGWALNMGQLLSLPLIALGAWLIWKKVNWGKDITGGGES